MGKEANPRRVAENEAMAVNKMIRTSPRKLNLVAAMIRKKPVAKALADLAFSKRRVAGEVKKTLQSAIANAENNHGLDVYDLIVAEAWVGKNLVMKRGRPRGRGRYGRLEKPFAQLTIKVRQEEQA
jgi:large subunit ribosomal protein L22